MLQAKFQDHKTSGSGEEDFQMFQVSWKSAHRFQGRRFLKGFYHIWCGGHLGHVTSIMSSDFLFLVPESIHKKFGLNRHSSI